MKAVAGVAASIVLVAGCGGGSDDSSKPEEKALPNKSSAAPEEARAPEISLPPGFDATKGWAVRSTEGLRNPVYAPHARAVLFLKEAKDGKSTQVVARDLATGTVRWTSEPVELPASGQHGGVDGTTALMVTSKEKTDYAVVSFSGEKGGDGASKSKKVSQLTAFPADGKGDGVKAGQRFEFPHERPSFTSQDSGGVLYTVDFVRNKGDKAIAVDVATGKTTTYRKEEMRAPEKAEGCRGSWGPSFDCDNRPALFGVTPKGPLATDGRKGFWLSGDSEWYSGNTPPAGADQGLISDVAADHRGGAVVARWVQHERAEIRDAANGRVRASVQCEIAKEADGQPLMLTFSGGRYASAGPVVLDLEEDSGYCFEETDDRKGVTFTTVDAERGIGYGTVPADTPGGDALPVEVDLAGDKVTPLSGGTRLPSWTAEGFAAYTPEADDSAWSGPFTAAFYPSK